MDYRVDMKGGRNGLGWLRISVFLRVLPKIMFNRNQKVYQKYSTTLLTLTWCHGTPADTPTRSCIHATSSEHQIDRVAPACYGGRQGGAHTLASNQNVAIRGGTAALLHQRCPVAVCDCQVVIPTVEMGLNCKCSEL